MRDINAIFQMAYPEGIPAPSGNLPVGWIGLRMTGVEAEYTGDPPVAAMSVALEVCETPGHDGETSRQMFFIGESGNPDRGIEPDPDAQNPETWKRRARVLNRIIEAVGVQVAGKTVGAVLTEAMGRTFLGQVKLEASDKGEFTRLVDAKPFEPSLVVVDENPTAKQRKTRQAAAPPLGAPPATPPKAPSTPSAGPLPSAPPGFGGRFAGPPVGARIPARTR